jgi:hypothetical protein
MHQRGQWLTRMPQRVIGTLPPCIEVEVDDVLRSAFSMANNLGSWSLYITYETWLDEVGNAGLV